MSCYNCGGSGYIITCIDDLCRAADECMHGDGEEPCPICHGEPDDDLYDWDDCDETVLVDGKRFKCVKHLGHEGPHMRW